MNIRVVNGLPFVSVVLRQGSKVVEFERVLLDTGSGGSVFSAHVLEAARIRPRPDAIVRQVVGIGGSESVVEIRVDAIQCGALTLSDFVIESGSTAYGFDFDAILGFDFLRETSAMIDLAAMRLKAKQDG